MTQLASAHRAAGIVTVAERLREIAICVLAVHASSRVAASEAMYAAVRYDTDLLDELFSPYRDLALKRLLGGVESDMRQHERAEQQKARGEGHPGRDDHPCSAPAAPPPDRRKAQEAVANVMRLTMLAGAARAWARRESTWACRKPSGWR